jgi:hypothetical protein
MVLTFGDDQKGFKVQFATDDGKVMCAKMRGVHPAAPAQKETSTWLCSLTS